MFRANDIVYTDQQVRLESGELAFKPYKKYTVRLASQSDIDDDEPVLINELGMLHALDGIEHHFKYMH